MSTLRISRYKNAWVARWQNTRIKLFPDHQFKEDGEKGNLIEFYRLQDVDLPAFCVSNKVRTVKGRAYTISSVWLTDEAAVALHRILSESIKERTFPKENEWPEDELSQENLGYILESVDKFPKGLSDEEVADKLNEMDLPMQFWTAAFDHYKGLNK
jgi:hypothetical protein